LEADASHFHKTGLQIREIAIVSHIISLHKCLDRKPRCCYEMPDEDWNFENRFALYRESTDVFLSTFQSPSDAAQ